MYGRLTGSSSSVAPGVLQTSSASERNLVTNFRWEMSPGLLANLDVFAKEFLAKRDIEEPISWEPALAQSGQFGGMRIGEVDLTALRALRRDGSTMTASAEILGLPLVTAGYANEIDTVTQSELAKWK